MSDTKWIIQGPLDPYGEGEYLYWSNDDGWGSQDTATVFTEQEHNELNLPLEAVCWTPFI